MDPAARAVEMGSVCSATHQPAEKLGNIPPKLAKSAFIPAQRLK